MGTPPVVPSEERRESNCVFIQEPEERWWQAGLNTRLLVRPSLGEVELARPLEGVCTPTVAGPLRSDPDRRAPVDLAFEAFVKAFRIQVDFLRPRAGV